VVVPLCCVEGAVGAEGQAVDAVKGTGVSGGVAVAVAVVGGVNTGWGLVAGGGLY